MQRTKSRSKPRHNTRRRFGLTRVQEDRLKALLRRSACSETWVDDQIVTRLGPGPAGQPIEMRLHDPNIFPPGGRQHTAMKWCRSCGRYTPAPAMQLIERRLRHNSPVISATIECDDCRIAADDERFRELYEAGLHLRPASSRALVGIADLRRRLKDRGE
jgi:hypothetical protein